MHRVLRTLAVVSASLVCPLPASAQNSPPWPPGDEIGMANTLGPATWQRCATHLADPNTDEIVSGDPNQQGTQMDALGHFAVGEILRAVVPALEHHAAIPVRGPVA